MSLALTWAPVAVWTRGLPCQHAVLAAGTRLGTRCFCAMGHTPTWTSLVSLLDLCMPCTMLLAVWLLTKHAQQCCRCSSRAAVQTNPYAFKALPVSCKRCAMLQSTTALSWMTTRTMLLCCQWERCQTTSCGALSSPGTAGYTPAGRPPGASSRPCAPGQPCHVAMGAAATDMKISFLSRKDTHRPQSSQHITLTGSWEYQPHWQRLRPPIFCKTGALKSTVHALLCRALKHAALEGRRVSQESEANAMSALSSLCSGEALPGSLK